MNKELNLNLSLTRETRYLLFGWTPEGELLRKKHFMGKCKTEAEKGKKIINGLKTAICPYCKEKGQRHLCDCEISMKLSNLNNRPFEKNLWLHGPIGVLP